MIRPMLLAALCALPAAPALAVTQAEVLSAEILPGWQTAAGTHMVALHLRLAPGWKTYWRSPGEAGIPPSFNWSGSQNLAGVRIHWPRPEVFDLNGMRTIGYRQELVLPIELTAATPGQSISLHTEVELGVCHDICMPAQVTLAAEIAGPGAPDAAIREALAARPDTAHEGKLATIGCTVEPIADGLRLTARMRIPATGGAETVVFEPAGASVWVSQAEVSRKGGELVAMSDLVADGGGPFALDRGSLTVTVLGSDRVVEIKGCPAP